MEDNDTMTEWERMIEKARFDKKVEDAIMNIIAILFWGGIACIIIGIIQFINE